MTIALYVQTHPPTAGRIYLPPGVHEKMRWLVSIPLQSTLYAYCTEQQLEAVLYPDTTQIDDIVQVIPTGRGRPKKYRGIPAVTPSVPAVKRTRRKAVKKSGDLPHKPRRMAAQSDDFPTQYSKKVRELIDFYRNCTNRLTGELE